MKLGVQYVSPLWFAATRMFLGALCLFVFLAAQKQLRPFARPDIPILVSVAVFQIGLPTALIHSGLLFLDAGRSAILVFTMPLWVAPMAVFFLGERLTRMKLAGLVFGLAGIAVLFNPLAFDFTDRSSLIGNGFMLTASLCFAIAIILVRRHPGTTPIIQLVPWQMLLGTIILVVSAATIEGVPDFRWSPALTAILAYNGPIASGFCFWAFLTVSRSLPAMDTALGSLGVPVIGVVSSALILGETLTPGAVTGLILILMGVLAVTSIKSNQAKTP